MVSGYIVTLFVFTVSQLNRTNCALAWRKGYNMSFLSFNHYNNNNNYYYYYYKVFFFLSFFLSFVLSFFLSSHALHLIFRNYPNFLLLLFLNCPFLVYVQITLCLDLVPKVMHC